MIKCGIAFPERLGSAGETHRRQKTEDPVNLLAQENYTHLRTLGQRSTSPGL